MSKLRVCNLICVILLAVMLVLQFLPYWHWVDESGPRSISIQGYVWSPYNGTEYDSDFEARTAKDANTIFFRENTQDSKFTPDRLAVAAALQLIFSAVSIFIFMKFPESPLLSLFTAIASFCGLLNYLGHSIFAISSLWQFHLAIQVITFLAGLVALYFSRQRTMEIIRSRIEAANAQ